MLCPPLLAVWGRGTPGAAALLSSCVEAATLYLLRWRGEDALAEAACSLLATLARLKGAAAQLVALAAWQRLAAHPPPSLPPRAQRLLLEALGRGAVAAPAAMHEEAVRALREPLHARLQAATAGCDVGSAAGRAELRQPVRLFEVLSLCDCLRGVARASSLHTLEPLFDIVAPTLPALAALVHAYEHDARALVALLKVHRDLAKAQMGGLPCEQAQQLGSASYSLIAQYARHVPPLHDGGAAGGAAEASAEAEHEEYRQVRTLLQLLSAVAARDLGGTNVAEAAAQAVLAAAELLLPRVSVRLLSCPKLCRQYFLLLSYLLDAHPQRTVALSSPLYDAVLAALRFGLQHHEVATTEAALQATYDLARHASQHAERAAPMAAMLQALLSHLAAELLCSRLHPDVIEPAAGNALLALIVAQQAHWQGMVAGLLAAQHEPHTRDAAAAAFGALLGTNGVSASLQKPNRVRFRANLERLLQHVRSSNMVLA